MSSSKRLLSAVAGLAMLAMPVSALAAHHDEGPRQSRPSAWHDRGFHNGWGRQQFAGRPYARGYVGPPREGHWNRPLPWNYGYAPNGWGNAQNGYYGCDADGDHCGPVNRWHPRYWNNGGSYNGGYYAPPVAEDYSWYQAMPPAGYSVVQQRDWLIARRRRAMMVLAQMRARGDRRGADRMVPIVKALNSRIAAQNWRMNGGYAANTYAPGRATGYGYASPLSSLVGTPYATRPGYYPNNSYYGNSPALGTLGTLVGPMLGLP
jgi:hypothetical protein